MERLWLALANAKACLGRRYTEWSIRAPELEAMMAVTAMAQEERGQSAMLGRLVRTTSPLVVATAAGTLDREADDWIQLVALAFLFDGAVTAVIDAVAQGDDSSFGPLTRKILQEERYHSLFAQQWVDRLMSHPVVQTQLQERAAALLPDVERWLDGIVALSDVSEHPDQSGCVVAARLAWRDHVDRIGLRIA